MNREREAIELDLFGVEKDESERHSKVPKILHRQRSFRDMQNEIRKIDPEILKKVIVSACEKKTSEHAIYQDDCESEIPVKESLSFSPKSTALQHKLDSEKSHECFPLTIFYNGTVSVFDLPQEKAEAVVRFAESGVHKAVEYNEKKAAAASGNDLQMGQTMDGGNLPIARRKSLQRFLEKRKERMSERNQITGLDS